jgi:hypothetical protein
MNREDEEKIYDEPGLFEHLAQDDTKVAGTPSLASRIIRERPVSIASSHGVNKTPQRANSVRGSSPLTERRAPPPTPRHASFSDLIDQDNSTTAAPTIMPRKKAPAPTVPSPYNQTPSIPQDIKTHRRMVSETHPIVQHRTHRRQASDTVTHPPTAEELNNSSTSMMKRNPSYMKALKDDNLGNEGGEEKGGRRVGDKDRPFEGTPPPLPSKHKEKIMEANGCVSGTEQPPPIVARMRSPQPGRPDPKPKPSIKRKQRKRALAQFDCAADHADELSFLEGETVIVVQKLDDDWWFGHIEGDESRAGVFPRIYVEEID